MAERVNLLWLLLFDYLGQNVDKYNFWKSTDTHKYLNSKVLIILNDFTLSEDFIKDLSK